MLWGYIPLVLKNRFDSDTIDTFNKSMLNGYWSLPSVGMTMNHGHKWRFPKMGDDQNHRFQY